MGFGSAADLLGFMAPKPGDLRTVLHHPGSKPQLLTYTSDVTGFSAATIEREVVAGLPDGVELPAEMLAVVAAAKRMDVWIEQGRRVQAWGAQQGLAEECWVDEDSGALRVPSTRAEVPSFVTAWVAEAPEIGAILDAFTTSAG